MSGFAWVALGAAVGAPLRYLVDVALRGRFAGRTPWWTLAVNVAGSLVLGVVVGAGTGARVPEAVALAVGTGFCGALTTWSTLGYEAVELLESGASGTALRYLALSAAAGLAAASAGYALAAALT